MLNLFNSFRVPGVEYVEVFHDDTDDSLFYMVPERPSLLRNDDGSPTFQLMAFARDFTLLADTATELPGGELEGGLIGFTTELRVSDEDQAKIRAYIQGGPPLLGRARFDGTRFLMLRLTAAAKPVKLAYPLFVDGSVSFGLLTGEDPLLVKGTAGTGKPSLSGTTLANYAALLGQLGVRFVRRGAEQGYLAGSVNYSLSFVARIPSVTIHIYGNAEDIYNEIKEHTQITETYTSDDSYSVYTYPQVSSLNEIKTMVTSLHVDIDMGDFTSTSGADPAAAQDIGKKVEEMALAVIQNQIMPRFFAPGLQPGLKAEKLGTNPLANKPGASGPPAPNNQMYLKDFTQEMKGSIDVTFNARTNITVQRHPNSGLLALITPQELAASISEADLSQPYFTLLDVPVRVTANFDTDPIAAIKVFLDYDQKDDKSGEVKKKTEEFVFTSNDKTYHFRTIMARDAEGRPKDTYRYRSQIVYKATAKTEDIAEVETNDRSLIIGYDKLDCVQVEAVLGAIPTGVVERVQVQFRYPDSPAPTAEATVVLTDVSPQGTWFTYTGGRPSREYEQTTTFFMADGQQIALPTQRTVVERLIVNAPFNDRLSVTFVAQGLFPPIGNIVISVHYDDGPDYSVDDVHTLVSAGETWKWEPNLRDKAKRAFNYKADISFADGTGDSTGWQPGTEGIINVGQVAADILEVEVVPTLVDFSKWKLVLVRMKYTDPTSGAVETHDVQLTPAGVASEDGLKWRLPLKDPAARSFSYSVQAFGVDGSRTDVPEKSTTDPLVLLEV